MVKRAYPTLTLLMLKYVCINTLHTFCFICYELKGYATAFIFSKTGVLKPLTEIF